MLTWALIKYQLISFGYQLYVFVTSVIIYIYTSTLIKCCMCQIVLYYTKGYLAAMTKDAVYKVTSTAICHLQSKFLKQIGWKHTDTIGYF